MKTKFLITLVSACTLIFTLTVTINPIFSQCDYDPSNLHSPCDNLREFLIFDSPKTQIEKINGIYYDVSEPVLPNSSVDKIIFHDVEFSPPYRHDYPRHTYSDVIFSDGTEETLSVLFNTDFTEHIKPQAGLVEAYDGIKFLVSIDLKELSPLNQIKSGVALIDVKCNEEKVKVIKYDKMSIACVFEETQNELWERGWATMRFYTQEDTSSNALCSNYEGKWHPKYEGCREITDLQCSLMGGKFVDNLKICYDGICPVDKTYTLCVTNTDFISREKENEG